MKPLTGPRYTLKCAGLHQARKIESLILDQMPSVPTITSLLSALPKQNSQHINKPWPHSDNGLNGHRKKVPRGHLSIYHFVVLPHLLSVRVHHFFPAIKWSNHGQAMYSQTFGQTYHNLWYLCQGTAILHSRLDATAWRGVISPRRGGALQNVPRSANRSNPNPRSCTSVTPRKTELFKFFFCNKNGIP